MLRYEAGSRRHGGRSQKSERQTRPAMKGQDRALVDHRSLNLSWNERSFSNPASSSLSCLFPLVMHHTGGSSCGLNGWANVTSLAAAS